MSTIPKALYELVREWRKQVAQVKGSQDQWWIGMESAAGQLEEQLRAWTAHVECTRTSEIEVCEQILGLPAKSERK